MTIENEITPKEEFVEIRPSKVSLVDEGANAQFVFIAKSVSKTGTSEAKSENEFKVAIDKFMTRIASTIDSTREWLMQAETDEESDIPSPIVNMLDRNRAELIDMSEAVENGGNRLEGVKVSGANRDKMVTMLDVLSENLSSAISKISSSEDEEISDEFKEELKGVISGFESVVSSFTQKACEEEEEEEKAVWTTAYINTLPDSAFLYIKPGGEKDEEEKTVPRTNRMFPYKDDEGNIDLPHLRNAIARIPQSNLSQELKDNLQDKARNILAEVEKMVEESVNETQEDSKMAIKFAEIAKSAEKVELKEVEVKKAVSSAVAKLDEISKLFGISTEELKTEDNWDIRWKLGESIDILVRAAKLENLLGSGSTEMQAPEEEEEMPSDEEEEMSSGEKVDKSSDSEKKVEKNTSEDKSSELAEMLKKVVGETVAPLTERLDKIEGNLNTTTETVEKMNRERPAPKGGQSDESIIEKKSNGGDESIFGNIIPAHLHGRVNRSKE